MSEEGGGNRKFTLVAGSLFLAIVTAWFFLHPNSPWFARTRYSFEFPEIGTLNPGDPVQVNGLPKGKVVSTRLLGESVEVTVAILEEVKIPVDSRIRVVNSGFLGKREVEILLGERTDYLEAGTRVTGGYDMGSTRLAIIALSALQAADSLLHITAAALDSTLLHPRTAESAVQLERGARRLQSTLQSNVRRWMADVDTIAQGLQQIKTGAVGVLDTLVPTLQGVRSDLDSIHGAFNGLQARASQLGTDLQEIRMLLESDSTTAGLVLAGPDFQARIDSTLALSKQLLGQIRRRGLDLNVDIW